MKVLLELRAGEGGDDAKSLVGELGSIYINYAEKCSCTSEIVRESLG